ncbi:ankyrin repeat domain-containing protein [Thalassovita sp.]|uniref:ankyrin repeat domain-containing protein n=1 Tax=Thalassovita sp. TaxID=1979401 RepID=UPI002B267E01|nr:ankyrin repeat domain-containing protein [Thalassovita sp.]
MTQLLKSILWACALCVAAFPARAEPDCEFWGGAAKNWRRVSAEQVASCLNAGRDPNVNDGLPVWLAAGTVRDGGVLPLLLDAGGTPHATHKKRSALHHAAKSMREDAPIRVAYLLEAGADPKVDTVSLPWIALEGQAQSILMLVQAGANPFERLPGGTTALHMAAKYNYPEVTQTLLELGLSVSARSNGGFEESGVTPLHVAASHVNQSVAEVLLEAGADANAETDKGQTPLHHLVRQDVRRDERAAKMVGLFVAEGADVNSAVNMGFTALHFAASLRLPLVTEALLAEGADGSIKDAQGNPPWHYVEGLVKAGGLPPNVQRVWWHLHDSQF